MENVEPVGIGLDPQRYPNTNPNLSSKKFAHKPDYQDSAIDRITRDHKKVTCTTYMPSSKFWWSRKLARSNCHSTVQAHHAISYHL